MNTPRTNFAIALGLLDLLSAVWFLGIFVGLTPVYFPPVATLLGIGGVVGSSIALKKGFAGSSAFLRAVLIAGIAAAGLGLAGALWISFALANIHWHE
jgi:hypothetical protein